MMLDTKTEQKWPLTTKKCFLSQTGSSSQGSFHAASRRWQFVPGAQLIVTARTRSFRYLAAWAGYFLSPEAGWWYRSEPIPTIKSRQPKGRLTRVSYHIPLAASSGFVSVLCKSVFYTKTFCVFYTLLHLEFLDLLWYLIDTKRWYQCTGKSFRF